MLLPQLYLMVANGKGFRKISGHSMHFCQGIMVAYPDLNPIMHQCVTANSVDVQAATDAKM